MQSLSIPTWPALRHLGTNGAVRSANVWALVVPIAAKLMEGVQDVVTLELLGHSFPIHLSLPFSWKVLFIAAIAFLFANIVYSVFCPSLIKETGAYRDFAEQKRSGTELANLLQYLIRAEQIASDVALQWSNWLNSRQVTFPQSQRQSNAIPPEMEERAFIEFYAIVVNALAKTNTPARACASLLYASGMIALGTIVVQNIWFVMQHW